MRSDIDWGDDNAHYLLQAKYIAQGTPQSQTHYIFNADCPVLGPPAYPVGYPLALAGIYMLKGLNFHAFVVAMSLALILLCLIMVVYYKDKHSFLTSVFLILIIVYNPWTLGFKAEIMSDIPFAVILLLATLIYSRFKNIGAWIAVGMLGGYLISVRSIGFVFPLAILAETIRNVAVAYFRKEKGLTKVVKMQSVKLLLILFLSFGFYFLLNHIIFKIPSDARGGYLSIFGLNDLDGILLRNLAYYTEIFYAFFAPVNSKWLFLPLISKSFVLVMVLLGFIKKAIRSFDFTDFLVVFYLLILFIYPYERAGIRFLFPLLPFFMSYAVWGLQSIHLGTGIKTPVKVSLIGLLILVQYIYGIGELNRKQSVVQQGPCTDDAWAAFDVIKNQTPKDAVFAFIKPRALALFTDRKCISNNFTLYDMDRLERKLDGAGVNYYLLYCRKDKEAKNEILEEMVNPPLEKYIAASSDKIVLFWSNQRFKLYRKVKFR
jgi:hypothetical protein